MLKHRIAAIGIALAGLLAALIAVAPLASAAPDICEGMSSCNATQDALNNSYIEAHADWCFYSNGNADIRDGAALNVLNTFGSTKDYEFRLVRGDTGSTIRGPVTFTIPNNTDAFWTPSFTAVAASQNLYWRIELLFGTHPVWRISYDNMDGPEPTWEDTVHNALTLGAFSCAGS